MSGGSMDYLSGKVEDASFREDTPLRRAFRTHLNKVARALHKIEWVDSCDSMPGSEIEAINACLAPGAELAQLIGEAQSVAGQLAVAILNAQGAPTVSAPDGK